MKTNKSKIIILSLTVATILGCFGYVHFAGKAFGDARDASPTPTMQPEVTAPQNEDPSTEPTATETPEPTTMNTGTPTVAVGTDEEPSCTPGEVDVTLTPGISTTITPEITEELPVEQPTPTEIPVTPEVTPEQDETVTPTPVPTVAPVNTPTPKPTATETPKPTATGVPKVTSSPTPTKKVTATPTPTEIPWPDIVTPEPTPEGAVAWDSDNNCWIIRPADRPPVNTLQRRKDIEAILWDLINDYRAENGVSPLESPYLFNVDPIMASYGVTSLGDQMYSEAIPLAKRNCQEIIADHEGCSMGATSYRAGYYTAQETAERLLSIWQGSKLHNANLKDTLNDSPDAVPIADAVALVVYEYIDEWDVSCYAAIVFWLGVEEQYRK